MSWYVLLYNRVRDVIVKVDELDRDDGVPDVTFEELKINGELDGYFVYVTTDGYEKWGEWKPKQNAWDTPQKVPEVVKLWRLVTT